MDHPLTKLFATHGLRLTTPRKRVFDVLKSAHEPLTVAEVTKKCQDTVDRASVYRTLALFEQLGATKRVTIGWKYKIELGDTFTPHHHHLVCQKCHKVIAVNEGGLELFISELSERHNFTPTEHYFEVSGVCEGCAG